MQDLESTLIRRLVQVCGLPAPTARRVVAEVLDAFEGTVDEFIARRHDELQRQGLGNDSIYRTIRDELAGRRFCAPELSERQIRRRIYG